MCCNFYFVITYFNIRKKVLYSISLFILICKGTFIHWSTFVDILPNSGSGELLKIFPKFSCFWLIQKRTDKRRKTTNFPVWRTLRGFPEKFDIASGIHLKHIYEFSNCWMMYIYIPPFCLWIETCSSRKPYWECPFLCS